METLAVLGRTLAFSLAAGVNLYATVALVGLASYFGWVPLPREYAVFGNPWVIGIASALYLVNALTAAFSRRIKWRGITYELKSPSEAVIISRKS